MLFELLKVVFVVGISCMYFLFLEIYGVILVEKVMLFLFWVLFIVEFLGLSVKRFCFIDVEFFIFLVDVIVFVVFFEDRYLINFVFLVGDLVGEDKIIVGKFFLLILEIVLLSLVFEEINGLLLMIIFRETIFDVFIFVELLLVGLLLVFWDLAWEFFIEYRDFEGRECFFFIGLFFGGINVIFL